MKWALLSGDVAVTWAAGPGVEEMWCALERSWHPNPGFLPAVLWTGSARFFILPLTPATSLEDLAPPGPPSCCWLGCSAWSCSPHWAVTRSRLCHGGGRCVLDSKAQYRWGGGGILMALLPSSPLGVHGSQLTYLGDQLFWDWFFFLFNTKLVGMLLGTRLKWIGLCHPCLCAQPSSLLGSNLFLAC